MTRDLYHNLGVVQLLKPQTINDTDTKTSLLDTRGFRSAVISLFMGVFTGADSDSYVTPVLQESDTTADTDFTTVAAADLQGAFTVVNSTSVDETVQTVGYVGTKRYIRLLLDFTTGTGGVTGALVAVSGTLARPTDYPASAPSPVAAT